MIAPLLRVAASAVAARTMRSAARDAALRVVMTLCAATALGVAALCLSCSAFILLARTFDSAAAWAILGAFWGLAGVTYFAVSRRRG
jgi:hypothetical protein